MADVRRTARRLSVGSLFRPAALDPRLLARTVTVVVRGARRRRAAVSAAVCATAGEHRVCPIRRIGTDPAAVYGPRCEANTPPGGPDASAGGAARRERAHEAVASRTTGPDDLASLLNMLDLRPGPDERGTGSGGHGRSRGGDGG
ncbi:hypothetical protein ABT144_24695 [Streptomyces sp. NPDC002039]|uniref:hypothetical protein n=1 Tax=Streptomyces sp. NPDC002039 TaxID=3154660 RepID=UPI00332C8DB5